MKTCFSTFMYFLFAYLDWQHAYWPTMHEKESFLLTGINKNKIIAYWHGKWHKNGNKFGMREGVYFCLLLWKLKSKCLLRWTKMKGGEDCRELENPDEPQLLFSWEDEMSFFLSQAGSDSEGNNYCAMAIMWLTSTVCLNELGMNLKITEWHDRRIKQTCWKTDRAKRF